MGSDYRTCESRHWGGSLLSAFSAACAGLVSDTQAKHDKPYNSEKLRDEGRSFFFHWVCLPCFNADKVRAQRKMSSVIFKKFRGLALNLSLTVPVRGPVPAAGQIKLRPGGA